jgi:hypothetical protein
MRPLILAAALALCGCATTYQLAVMPRDSGKLYEGAATDTGYGEGPISITIEGKTYNGSWVQTVPDRTYGYVSGGWGWGGWHRGGFAGGGFISMDNPNGGLAKALLSAADGSGLRCDLQSGWGRGGGVCFDDKGRMYDVQVRSVSTSSK